MLINSQVFHRRGAGLRAHRRRKGRKFKKNAQKTKLLFFERAHFWEPKKVKFGKIEWGLFKKMALKSFLSNIL